MSYAIEHIAHIISGELLCFRQDTAVDHLLTDSRRLIFPASTLFFALPGPRRGGDQFVDELYYRGVRNFVVSGKFDVKNYQGANFILVKNCLAALQQLATFHRIKFDIPVIGITGSNGKTIVKEWLYQLLADDYNIVRSPRSYNSQIGVPLSVWQMSELSELAIFEGGISRPGEMKKLEKVIQPTIGILTNIGDAHSEGFNGLLHKAEEKIELFKNARVLIYNGDDPIIANAVSQAPKSLKRFCWGTNKSAQVKIKKIENRHSRTTVDIIYSKAKFSIDIPFSDSASVENAITCISALLYLNIGADTISARLLRLAPVAMRLELKSGVNNTSIINDSYSTDVNSLRIALDFMQQQQQHPKRTVILSDILESGQKDKKLYQYVAQLLLQKKVNRLIGVGEKISAEGNAFRQLGEVAFYPSFDELKRDFHRLHFHNETILVKGARKFEFERIDQLLSERIHQTVLEINLNALAGNLKRYQALLKPTTKLMAMVKSFSYGGGSFEIANLLQFHKVDYLGVAYADEGIELRKSQISLPMMVMNPERLSFDSLLQYQLEPVIYSGEMLEMFDRYLQKEGVHQFPVHVELETGMNRLGFSFKELRTVKTALQTTSFRVQSVFSHLAASEDPDQDNFTSLQAELFAKATGEIESALGYPFLKHISNSAAIARRPELQMDMVRLGIGLYGIDAAPPHALGLEEVSTLKSTIAQIKHLEPGETVGYSRKGVATQRTTIATVGIGYGDGYPRALGNGNGKMLVKGQWAPVIGNVCMDMTMIDITGVPEVREGDEVIVFGGRIPVTMVAGWARTIVYEILTGISQRVKRVYFEE